MLIGDYPTAYPGYSDVSAGPRLYDGSLFVGTLPNYEYTVGRYPLVIERSKQVLNYYDRLKNMSPTKTANKRKCNVFAVIVLDLLKPQMKYLTFQWGT